MKVKSSTAPTKHLPQRTCIACRKTGFKRELVRLVAIPDEGIVVDLTGKRSGRGAYLCPDRECWENALGGGKLEYALRVKINPENKDKLVKFVQGLNNTNSEP